MAFELDEIIAIVGGALFILIIVVLGIVVWNPPSMCQEAWTCSNWSLCLNGQQTRSCVDQNQCGTTAEMPDIVRACVSGCGDGVCTANESCSTCSADCGTCGSTQYCGNAVCDGSETCSSCSADCGACQTPFCGNAICEGTETCNTCAADCGQCECTESWSCTEWGDCVNGTQTRSCSDANACGTTQTKPSESQSCEVTNLQEDVKIIRDEWGVANVFASTDAGAFYGMGYATAEDRMFQMEYLRLYMYGRLSELIGKKSCTGGGCPNSVEKDVVMRHLQFYEYAPKRYQELDAETRLFLDAYAAGVNQYLADHKGNLLYLFGSHVPAEWKPWDSLLAWDYMTHPYPDEGEIIDLHRFEGLVDSGFTPLEAASQMVSTAIIINSGATIQQSDVPLSLQQEMQAYADAHPPFGGIATELQEAPHFSHGWAVGGSKSGTGESVIIGDPKFQIREPAYWYESHIVGKTFNARGNSVPGALGYFVGYTPYTAWSHTGGVGDYTDLFRLKMVGNEQYEYDGQVYSFSCTNQTIKVKNGTSQNERICSTPLGPVVTDILDYAKAGEEYVMVTIPIADPGTHTVQALIGMMRATNITQLDNAFSKWRTPRTNTIFVSNNGDVGYRLTPVGVTRSSLSPLAGSMAQDGSDSKYGWVEFIPHKLRPHVINPAAGYVSSGNNLPVGSWYPIKNGGVFSGGDTLRSAQAREELQLANADGKITPAEAFAIHSNTNSWVYDTLIRAAVHVRDVQTTGANLSNNSLRALTFLEQWQDAGGYFHTDQPLYALAHHMSSYFRENTGGINLVYGGGESGLVGYARHLRDRMNANPNIVLADVEINYYNWLLEKAWNDTTNEFGTDPAQWKSKFNSSQKAGLPVLYFSSLFENYGSLDPSKDTFFGPMQSPRGDLLFSDIGQVFSIYVDYTNVENAKAISPFGLSEDPSNINYRDQVSMWQNGQYRTSPLKESEVMKYFQSQEIIKYTPVTP